jgi:rapamycin-insensitive companion of mTOR
MQPIRRRRFNTLELDLSCTKNKFPIKHRESGPIATSTLQRPRPISLSANTPQQQQSSLERAMSSSVHAFESTRSSLHMISPLLSPPPLFCEQRILQSRSEATLSSSTSNIDNNIKTTIKRNYDDDESKKKKDEESR